MTPSASRAAVLLAAASISSACTPPANGLHIFGREAGQPPTDYERRIAQTPAGRNTLVHVSLFGERRAVTARFVSSPFRARVHYGPSPMHDVWAVCLAVRIEGIAAPEFVLYTFQDGEMTNVAGSAPAEQRTGLCRGPRRQYRPFSVEAA